MPVAFESAASIDAPVQDIERRDVPRAAHDRAGQGLEAKHEHVVAEDVHAWRAGAMEDLRAESHERVIGAGTLQRW